MLVRGKLDDLQKPLKTDYRFKKGMGFTYLFDVKKTLGRKNRPSDLFYLVIHQYGHCGSSSSESFWFAMK